MEIRTEVKSLTFGSPTESTTRLAGQLQKDRTAELLTLSGALKVSQEENAVLREKCDRRSATFNTLRVRYERLRFFTVVTLIAVAVLVGLKFLCVPGQCRSTPAIPGLESSLWHQALYGIAGFEVQRPWQLALPTVRCHLFEASVILDLRTATHWPFSRASSPSRLSKNVTSTFAHILPI